MSDVLLLSLGTTKGLRVADAGFAELLRRAGASVSIATTRIGAADRLRRGYPVNDLVEALAARRALAAALTRERPRAAILSTTTAALLAPALDVPFAIRFDAPAALNRPGARNAVLHALERRQMARARLLLPTSTVAAAAVPRGAAPAVVVPIPIESADGAAVATGESARVAVAYTPDPRAKGLDLLCAAWAAADVEDARLDVFGIDAETARAFLARRGVAEPAGVRWCGLVAPAAFRAALGAAHAFVVAARWEDYGQAPLEALADGALLVTSPAAGPYEALPLARRLDAELVAPSLDPAALAPCIARAFAREPDAVARYRADAAAALRPYAPEAAVATLAADVLPQLLAG